MALYFLYRPEPTAAWTYGLGGDSSLGREVRLAHLLTGVHAWVAWLALPTAVVAAVLLAVPARVTERVAPGLAIGAGLVVGVASAQISGRALPWDQLALWAVTVGTNISGYTWLRDGSVRFALMGGTEIAPSTLLKWLVLHVGLGVVVGGLAALGWRRTRQAAPAPTPADDGGAAPEIPVTV